MSRTVRGVAERYTLDAAALRSAEARWLAERAEVLAEQFREPAKLKLDAQEAEVPGPGHRVRPHHRAWPARACRSSGSKGWAR